MPAYRRPRYRWPALAIFTLLAAPPAPAAGPPTKAENVIVVTLDGFRWQDMFDGADESFMDARLGGVKNVAAVKAKYLRPTPAERRDALMPFFWGTVAKKGQVFGNKALKSPATITNGLKFSYPGYSELFCGFADPQMNSNAKRENPNLSVLEFLNGRPGFQGKVEAVCTWGVFPSIFRTKTSGLPVQAAWEPLRGANLSDQEVALNEAIAGAPRYWPDCGFDFIAFGETRIALDRRKPRVLYVGLGETDEWGHGRRYDLYLDSARNADKFLAELWGRLQADPQYKDKTALLVTTDHGRGPTRADWTDHGKGTPGAEFIWAAVLGPDTPALGERENTPVTQSQVAATVAALVGEDFLAASPKSAAPLPVFGAK